MFHTRVQDLENICKSFKPFILLTFTNVHLVTKTVSSLADLAARVCARQMSFVDLERNYRDICQNRKHVGTTVPYLHTYFLFPVAVSNSFR